MDLSIIIVSWNTKTLLQECLVSIYETTEKIKFEVFVVDNASSDGSIAMVKDKFKKVCLIESNINMGFARANNIAFPLAVGRYVLLLNSDTVVLSGALDLAVDFMDKNKDAGALTPKILNADGTVQHPCYVKEPSLFTECYELFQLRLIFKLKRKDSIPAANVVCDVAHACGCSLFLKKEALERVGYLDERMIFSFEDADICMRVKRDGWRILYYPDSKIVHFGGASRSKHKNKAVNAILQSKYVFYGKYHGRLFVFALAVCSVVSAFIRIIYKVIALIGVRERTESMLSIKYYLAVILWHFKRKNKKRTSV